MSIRRACRHSSDSFCYVCGLYIPPKQVKHKIKPDTKFIAAYEAYFGMPVLHQDVWWAPHVTCGSCRSNLEGWFRGLNRKMPFSRPRIWREPSNHYNDCYFCNIDLSCYKKPSDRKKIEYPELPSTSAPVSNSAPLCPVPPRATVSSPSEETIESEIDNENIDKTFYPNYVEPHLITQTDLNDLVRDLELSKEKAELLGSRLNQWNLLGKDCQITFFRKRHREFSSFFNIDNDLCYCSDIDGLFDAIGLEHKPDDWRLFIDSSVKSLKAVLLHNGNIFPSIPIAHSVHMKEEYNNVKKLLEKVQYHHHNWDVCGDFKMLGFFLGLQGGYTKYSCFLCLWDSRADKEHYIKRIWPSRNELIPGKENVQHLPLVLKEKILLPPLHIKLGLAKQFIKALDKESPTFCYIRNMFPKLSIAKVQAGIFTGPQIRKMLSSEILESKMNKVEKRAWTAFREVVNGFLGNHKSPNYKELVRNLLKTFKEMGCRMSLKVHFLQSHLDFFRENLGHFSEEHGERFHQDIQKFEKRYEGKWTTSLMADYVWSLIRESEGVIHKRQNRSNIHF